MEIDNECRASGPETGSPLDNYEGPQPASNFAEPEAGDLEAEEPQEQARGEHVARRMQIQEVDPVECPESISDCWSCCTQADNSLRTSATTREGPGNSQGAVSGDFNADDYDGDFDIEDDDGDFNVLDDDGTPTTRPAPPLVTGDHTQKFSTSRQLASEESSVDSDDEISRV